MLYITKGYAASETNDATERAAALAEKSGNLTQLVSSVIVESSDRPLLGRLTRRRCACRPGARACPREGSPTILGRAHILQLMTRYYRGDFVGAEKHFTAGLKFFDDPGFTTGRGQLP